MPTRARMPAAALDYFRQEGQRGGRTAAKNMSPAARAARAKKGATARWAGKKKAARP